MSFSLGASNALWNLIIHTKYNHTSSTWQQQGTYIITNNVVFTQTSINLVFECVLQKNQSFGVHVWMFLILGHVKIYKDVLVKH